MADGVLLVRDDGVSHVIPVDSAQAVPAGLVASVERLLDTLGAPKQQPRRDQKQDAEP